MADEIDDPSMIFHGAAGRQLASRQIALELAKMVFSEIYGAEQAQLQDPWEVTDGGDRWVLQGSLRPDPSNLILGKTSKGRGEVVILKANCRVVRLIQKMAFPYKENPG